jgi:hypothetical protein
MDTHVDGLPRLEGDGDGRFASSPARARVRPRKRWKTTIRIPGITPRHRSRGAPVLSRPPTCRDPRRRRAPAGGRSPTIAILCRLSLGWRACGIVVSDWPLRLSADVVRARWVVRCCQTAPHAAHNTATLPMRMKRLRDDVLDRGSLVTRARRAEPPTHSVSRTVALRATGAESFVPAGKFIRAPRTQPRSVPNGLHHPSGTKPVAGRLVLSFDRPSVRRVGDIVSPVTHDPRIPGYARRRKAGCATRPPALETTG